MRVPVLLHWKIRWIRPRRQAAADALARLGHAGLDPDMPVNRLSIGEQQVVEIARALVLDAKLIIMDEPTSSLSATDTQALFAAVGRLREQGVSIIYISHFLEEVKQVADHFTVLRDGRNVASGALADTDVEELIHYMVGRELDEMFPRVPHELGEPALQVNGLSNARLKDVCFTLQQGEIMGVAGLVGSGRTEMLRALFGLDAGRAEIRFAAGPATSLRRATPRRAMRRGLDLLSENRKDEGLAGRRPVRDNLTLSMLARLSLAGIVRGRRERQVVDRQIRALGIKVADPMLPADTLSGGNQQKVAIGRILASGGDVFLFDEPTRGVDVGSKVEIYRLIGRLAAAGKAVIMVSSYLPELFGVCDSLAVMHRGAMSDKRPIAAWTKEQVMAWATAGRTTRKDALNNA